MSRRLQRYHPRPQFARQARRIGRIRTRTAFLALIVAGGASVSSVAAQDPSPHVDRFTVDEGLAENRVQAVAQDPAGFIWLGGDRGLQRFDGYSFTQYSALDSAAPAELRGLIDVIRVDAWGTLWVQASGALFRRDAASHRLVRAPLEHGTYPFSAAWAPDSTGRIWVMDGSALRWIEPGNGTPSLQATADQASRPDVKVLATSRSGAVWLANGQAGRGSVVRLDPASGGIKLFALEAITVPQVMLEDARGQVWVGGDGGVELLASGGDRFRSLPAFRGLAIRTLVPEDTAVMLVPTDGALSRVDRLGRVIRRWDLPADLHAGVLPTDIAVDREGGIWVGTLANGVMRIDPRMPLFRYASSRSSPPLALGSDFITAIAEPDSGTLWIGTLRGGAYRVTDGGARIEAFRHGAHRPTSLISDEVLHFASDKAGHLWVATNRGICRFDRGSFDCHSAAQGTSDMVSDADGYFWLANGQSSVVRFNPATGEAGPEIPTPAPVAWLQIDPESGDLWMGGGALFRARVALGRVVSPPERIAARASQREPTYDLCRDSRGSLWLGGYQGLERWDSGGRQFTGIDVAELRDVTVFSIEDDTRGSLWLGTSHGLVHYSPATGLARRYRREDGVLSGEFNRRASLRLRNGEMIFGGADGLTRVQPAALLATLAAPPIVFTRWRRLTSSGPVETSVDSGAPLVLGPGDHAFSIDFASLTFAAGPARRYRYRLEGLSSEWIESTDHVVSYPAPPPGRYAFRVQSAEGPDGEWSAPGAVVGLWVVPPFWNTAWFRGLLLAGFLAVAWGAHRNRLRHALATERLRLRISRDLHDEIGAGLSSIALLSDSAGSTGVLAEPERAHLDRIGQSAREMVDDLRDIVWAIDPEADQLDDVVTRMKDVAANLLRHVRVTFHAPAAAELSARIGMAARRDLLLLYKELLHNVARHAQATEVRIDVVARGTVLELTVADNGIGFDPTDSRAGTGSKSVRERVARLGGKLEVTSQPGCGTIARLTLGKT